MSVAEILERGLLRALFPEFMRPWTSLLAADPLTYFLPCCHLHATSVRLKRFSNLRHRRLLFLTAVSISSFSWIVVQSIL